MNKKFILIAVIHFMTLNFSCAGEKSSEKEITKSEFLNPLKPDTLKFNSGIRAIFQASNGNYWIGSHQEGICLFDGESFQYFTKNVGLMDNQIRTIQEDENGNIWIGTAHGVSRYDGEKFTNYTTTTSPSKVELKSTDINLWFNAGEKAGINWFDGQNLNYMPFPLPENENSDKSYGVTGISTDKEGKVWIGTYSGLFSFDGNEMRLFDKSVLNLNDNEQLHIRSVFADSKGHIWIGNNGIGVLLLEGNSAVNFSAQNGLIHQNSNRSGSTSPAGTLQHVFVIAEDAEGNIWFGDRDTGAWKFDGKTMTNYTIDDNLSTPMIWSIYNDNDNNLLFGMAGGGVYTFNGKSFDKTF